MNRDSEPREPFEADLDGFPVAADPEHRQARETLEVLVSQYTDEVRHGGNPSIEEYARRYRHLANEIRELFPLVSNLERWKSDNEVDCLRRNVRDEFPLNGLGPYRFLRELGRGGMGIVFEAVHKNSPRLLALKLFPWRFASDMAQWKACFRREAATIAGLRHRNIVRVYSFGVRGGYCYYVMQRIEGITLDLILRKLHENDAHFRVADLWQSKRPVDAKLTLEAEPGEYGLSRDSWSEFASICLQVASALDHAHSKGVLHNDVKPANLLLTARGHVIVTDFGVGRRLDEDLPGVDDHAMGTLRFMAPERLRGSSDARSDVYSLGATLYELATQTPAFDARDRRQLVGQIMKSKPKPPREIVPGLPRALETIIQNAMAREPADRYASAAAFAADLSRFLNDEPIQSTRPGFCRRALNWLRRWFARAPQRS